MLGKSCNILRRETDAVVAQMTGLLQQKSMTTIGRAPRRGTPSSSETPSALRFQQLTIASDRFKRQLPVCRFAENADDRRAHLFGEVVWHSLGLRHDHVRLNFKWCKLW